MDRRTLLRRVVIAGMTGLAGCTGGGNSLSNGDSATTPTPVSKTPQAGAEDARVRSVAGTELPVSKDALVGISPSGSIPAITEPAFADDWRSVDLHPLDPDTRVIGVTRAGEARAYPLLVLNHHEVVNDRFHGPLLVTYCPLCGSGIAAKREVRGQSTVFDASGFLWNSGLVMTDELTESYWSQIAGTAIRGPATGRTLSLVPATITSWVAWRKSHPNTAVLLPPPASGTSNWREIQRDYTRNPYRGYADNNEIGMGRNTLPETEISLHPKTHVLGITGDGTAKAYPLNVVRSEGVVNDTVGSRPVVVSIAADETTLVAYDRRVGLAIETPHESETSSPAVDQSTVLAFERSSATHLRAGGSRWLIATGRAVDGPYEGTKLARATNRAQLFWFAWLDFHPETSVYGQAAGETPTIEGD